MVWIMLKKIVLLCLLNFFAYAQDLPVSFVDNHAIGSDELYSALDLHRPYFYEFWKKPPTIDTKTTNLVINRLKNFYKSKGFYHSFITVKQSDKMIEFHIKEKKPIIVSTISVLSKFDLSSYIPFEKGVRFQSDLFEKSKKDIKIFYKNRGFCKVNLDAKAWIDIEKNRAYLAYDVRQNPLCHFGDIKIVKPKDIDEKIIKSLLYFKKGDLYSLKKLKESYKSFYAHSGISSVMIKSDMQQGFDIDTTVKVDETKKPIRFQVGGGVNSDKGLELALGVKNRNFYGNLKTVGFSIKYTPLKDSLSVDMSMPLQKRRTVGGMSEYSDEKFLGYKERKFLSTIYIKQRRVRTILQGAMLFDYSRISDSDDLLTYSQGDFFIVSPKISWIYDSRDDPLEPTSGYLLRAEVMGSLKSVVSDASYYKYNLEAAYILPFLPSVMAFKVDYGSIHVEDGSLPASYRFYAGGMSSNRAYSYRKLGPTNAYGDPLGLNSVLNFTAEYRFGIYGDIGGILFSDDTYIGIKDSPDFSKLYSSFGFGIRYKTPIGPIALDFGFDTKEPMKQYAFHFRIGELF